VDEDVKLSVQQAHEKWIIKAVIFGLLGVLSLVVLWSHDCNSVVPAACSDAMVRPDGYSSTVKCPDPRQTLTWPQGWTWGKCSCPVPVPDGK
jgi:hypothetical protein